MALDWSKIIGSGIEAGIGAIGANQGKKAAQRAAASTRRNPYSIGGPAGSVMFDPRTNQANITMGDSPFNQMFNALGISSLANAATAPGSFLYGADPELAKAYEGLTGQGIIDASQGRYDILTKLAQPYENRAFQGMQDRLFGQGRLGTSGGGIEQEAMMNAMSEADLRRQLSAQDWAQTNALNRFTGAREAVTSGQAGQRQQAEIGGSSWNAFRDMMQTLLQQGQLGVQAGSGVDPGAAANLADASMSPWKGFNEFLKNSGAYSGAGDWIGGKFGQPPAGSGGIMPPQQPGYTPAPLPPYMPSPSGSLGQGGSQIGDLISQPYMPTAPSTWEGGNFTLGTRQPDGSMAW